MMRQNLPSLLGRRVVIAGDGAIAEAIARHAVTAGARIHLIAGAARAVRAVARELGATCTIADLTQTGPTEEAFAQAQQRLAGLDAVVTACDPEGFAPSLEVHHTLELNAIPPALALGAVTRATIADGPDGTVLIGSVLDHHPEEGFTSRSYAFATGPAEAIAQATTGRLDFAAHSQAATPQVVHPTAGTRRRKPARVGGSAGDAIDRHLADWLGESNAAPAIDPNAVAQGAIHLLRGHQVTSALLRHDAPTCMN